MKFHLISTLLCFLTLSAQVSAQKQVCKNIYVWDFTDENGQKTSHSQLLTQEVEDALTATSCRVLQRRNYAKLSEQIDNEDAIQTIENMSGTISQELQSIKAETVLFGKVQMDFSGNIMLSVSFQHLLTKEILKSESLMLAGEDAHNLEQRKQKISDFISYCVGPRIVTNEERSYWQQVQELGTPEAYQKYLSRYPGGQFKSQAEQALADEAVWQEIQHEIWTHEKIRKLKNYTENPQAPHYTEARSQLENLLRKNEKYDDYLVYFPNGRYADQIKQRREEEFYNAANSNPYHYAEDYLSEYPNGKYAQQVKQMYEDDLYARAVRTPTVDTEKYLAKFPNGRYVGKLDDLFWGRVLSESSKFGASLEAKEYLKLFPGGKRVKAAREKITRN